MKQFLEKMSLFFENIPDMVRRFRWLIWSLFFLILVGYGSGASRFQLDLSDESFFNDDDPVRIAYNQLRQQFGGDENIYLVYAPKDGDVFSEQSLKAVHFLQEDILNYRLKLEPGETSPLDFVRDVQTIINASYLEASDDALISRQFVGEEIPSNNRELQSLKNIALNHPDYPLLYVSEDATYGGILIRTSLGSTPVDKGDNFETLENADQVLEDWDITEFDNNASAESTLYDTDPEFEFVDPQKFVDLMHTIEDFLQKPEYTSVLTFHPVGNAVVHTYVMDVLFEQINMVMGLSILLIMVMLWVLFRSVSAVLWPVTIIAGAAILTVATLGWLELRMNMMVNITVFLILVVGVADSVHLLSGYAYFRNHGNDHQQAIRLAFKNAGMAILLTSITTAIGMLSLYLVPIEAIQIFGFSAAVGVIFAFIISVVMLPLMLDLWRPLRKLDVGTKPDDMVKHHIIQRVLRRVEYLSHLNPNLNIGVFTLIFVFFAFGLTKINVDSNPMSLFKPETPIVKDFDLVDKKMGGTQSVEIMINMGQEDGLKNPNVLMAMDKVQHYLKQEFPGEVIRTNSLVNIVKDSNKNLNGGHETSYTIPTDKRVLEQTLFLFNNANPKDRRLVVSDNYQQAHITASFANVGSQRYVQILEKIKPKLDEIFTPLQADFPNMKITTTGGMTIFARLLDLLSWSQIKGFGIALALISIILFIVLSSIKLGLVALYPNLFPLVVMFGMMGYLGIPLDVDTLIIAPLMIGIVVDDTIHFLNHYRAEVQRHGDVYRGISVAFREVGQAITFTSIILALSFATMAFMDHQGLKNFGILSAITIMTALVAELFLLPALLVKTKADMSTNNNEVSMEPVKGSVNV